MCLRKGFTEMALEASLPYSVSLPSRCCDRGGGPLPWESPTAPLPAWPLRPHPPPVLPATGQREHAVPSKEPAEGVTRPWGRASQFRAALTRPVG